MGIPRQRRCTAIRISAAAVLMASLGGSTEAFPDGFGRFGRINEDGLLTLLVTPTHFETFPTEPDLRGTFGLGTGTASVVSLDATQKTLAISGGSPGEPSQIRYTLLYPGFSATFGTQMEIRFTGSTFIAQREPAQAGRTRHWILVRAQSASCNPILIAFRSGFNPASWSMTSNTLTVQDPGGIGEVRILTPRGIASLPANPPASALSALIDDCETWAAREIPVLTSFTSAITSGREAVHFTEQFTASGPFVAPVSPVLAFAMGHGYPASVEGGITNTNCLTAQGPFAHVSGPSASYELPLPPIEERGYLRPPGQAARQALLNDLVGHLAGPWVTNAVDMAYAGMTNAALAWPLLTPANQAAITNAWSTYLSTGFAMPPYAPGTPKQPWNEEIEPFSGESYIWTYHITGVGPHRYDIDWGNALPLLGLQAYATRSGDWPFVSARWNAVQRIYRYFDLGHDWCWMTVVNGDHGWSTGTGDPYAATLAGTIACVKMARALGESALEEKFAAHVARICVGYVARLWYTDWARAQGLIGSQSLVLGFMENEAFTRAVLGTQDPWGASNILSADGVIHTTYAPFIEFGGNALQQYEDRYAAAYPAWYDGSQVYPFTTTYNGNSVYVAFPHIFGRTLLGEPTATLWNYVDSCESNRNNAWIGPPVIAEILARDTPMLLTQWQPARLVDAVWSPAQGRAVLEFDLLQSTHWQLTARLTSTEQPIGVLVNGSSVPFSITGDSLSIQRAVNGSVQVEVVFSAAPPDLIIDNTDAEFSTAGSWPSSANSGHYLTNSLYHFGDGGASSATWRPSIPRAGFYDVYAWWVASSNRATAAPYEVTHAGGTTSTPQNQTINGSQWVLLGRFSFDAGTAGAVVLRSSVPGTQVVSADAVRFTYASPVPAGLVLLGAD